ncbi:MAG: cytochrome c biogenesis protein CcdA [Gemmatimonadota bacterium]
MIEGGGVPYWLAFVAGLLSFASACVLPIVPGYGVLIAGISLSEEGGRTGRWPSSTVRYALLFLLGFGLLFVLSAATATFAGDWIRARLSLFEAAGAVAIGLLGLALLGRSLSSTLAGRAGGRRWTAAAGVAALAGGAGFAAAWTPCIGPVLAEILLYGTFPETLVEGVILLTVYTAGLATPFLFIGVALGWLVDRFSVRAARSPRVQGGLGALLLVFSGLLLTGYFARVTAYLAGFGLLFEIGL